MKLKDCVIQKGPDSSDERRDIFDLLGPDFPDVRHVNIIVAKKRVPGKPWAGGNHYHTDDERFRVACGTVAKLVMENIDTGERMTWTDLGPGTEINVPARTAHATLPSEGMVLVGGLRLGFNPNDLNPYKLMDDDGNELPFLFKKGV